MRSRYDLGRCGQGRDPALDLSSVGTPREGTPRVYLSRKRWTKKRKIKGLSVGGEE